MIPFPAHKSPESPTLRLYRSMELRIEALCARLSDFRDAESA